MTRTKSSHTGYKSSVTGRFAKRSYAKRYPSRTQKESIPNPGHGDTGRSKSADLSRFSTDQRIMVTNGKMK